MFEMTKMFEIELTIGCILIGVLIMGVVIFALKDIIENLLFETMIVPVTIEVYDDIDENGNKINLKVIHDVDVEKVWRWQK